MVQNQQKPNVFEYGPTSQTNENTGFLHVSAGPSQGGRGLRCEAQLLRAF